MIEKIKGIPKRILEWWNKFDAKHKIVVASAVAAGVLALVILGLVLTSATMVELVTCESTKDASEIKSLLEAEGIETEVSTDGLLIKVNEEDLPAANLALGSNGYPADDYNLEEVFSGGFSSTEADKKKRYTAYLEEKIASDLKSMEIVEDARVTLDIPVEDGTIISKDQDTYVSVTLTLTDEVDDDVANSMAKFISTAVGNKDTASVTILDSKANLIFSGETVDEMGISSTQIASTKDKYENAMRKKVRSAVLDTKMYDAVTVAPNLQVSTSNKTVVDKQYTPAEGQDQGVLDSEMGYESISEGGTAGTPGTDSNDDTTYEILDQNGTRSEVTEFEKNYKPNETETTIQQGAGEVLLDESSISVVATKYTSFDEKKMKEQGQLDNMTFDEFKDNLGSAALVEVDEALYELVADATGIDRENITILSYEIPVFNEMEEEGLPYTMILTIVMIVLVLALLAFVVFRGTKSVVVEDVESEVSVEELLASTRDENLEDIAYEEKSEVRKMIEKFVDENPSAVAQLLRNWLNDDWE